MRKDVPPIVSLVPSLSTKVESPSPGQRDLDTYLFFAENITPRLKGFTDEYIEQLLDLFSSKRADLVEIASFKLANRGIVSRLLDFIGPSAADFRNCLDYTFG